MSVRALALSHGIKNHSVVADQARSREWARKRKEYRLQAAERAVTHMADDEGKRVAQEARVRDNAIEAIDHAIARMREDLSAKQKVLENGEWVERPLYLVKPQDVALLIDRLNVLFGRPATITEERNLGINLSAAASPELLRGIVEATRGLGGPSDATSSPLPRADTARTN